MKNSQAHEHENVVALRKEINALRKELFNLKLNKLSGQIKDTSQFSKLRVKIAQKLTLLTQSLRSV